MNASAPDGQVTLINVGGDLNLGVIKDESEKLAIQKEIEKKVELQMEDYDKITQEYDEFINSWELSESVQRSEWHSFEERARIFKERCAKFLLDKGYSPEEVEAIQKLAANKELEADLNYIVSQLNINVSNEILSLAEIETNVRDIVKKQVEQRYANYQRYLEGLPAGEKSKFTLPDIEVEIKNQTDYYMRMLKDDSEQLFSDSIQSRYDDDYRNGTHFVDTSTIKRSLEANSYDGKPKEYGQLLLDYCRSVVAEKKAAINEQLTGVATEKASQAVKNEQLARSSQPAQEIPLSGQTNNVANIAAALNNGVAMEVIPQDNFEAYMADTIMAEVVANGINITAQIKESIAREAKDRMDFMREDAQALSNYLQKLNKEGGNIDSNSVDAFLSAQRWFMGDFDKNLLTQYALSLMAQEAAGNQIQ